MKTFLISCLVFGLVPNTSAAVRPLLRGKIKPSFAQPRRETTNPAAPQMVHTPIYRQSVTLLGQTSSSEAVVFVDPISDRKSAPHLRLQWDVSSIVDLSLSTLMLEVDNDPIFSSTLQTLPANRTLDLSLSGVSGGFHVIRVRARLLTAGDPCLSLYDRELWLRLSKESELSYLRIPSEQKDEHVFGMLNAWQSARSPVNIKPSLPLQRSTLGAYIQAARWLQRNGLRSDSTEEGSSKSTLVLRTASSGPDTAIPWEPALLGSLERRGSQLVATARNGDDLAALFLLLQHSDSLSTCTERLCMFARHGLSQPKEAAKPSSSRTESPPGAVVTLADQGLPQGFGAKGGGWHQLRIHWDRPDSVLLSGEPELRLFVQSAALAALDQNASTLSVKMGDRPLASFSPGLLQSDRMPLRIKIPKELWDQSPWNFSIDTNLRTVPQKHCQSSDESTLWLTLGAQSGVYADIQKRIYPGTLTAVAELSKTEPVQIVFSKTLTWPAVAALAAVLGKLDDHAPWQIVESQTECAMLCIVPQVGALPDTSPLALLAIHGDLHWIDRHDSFFLPLLPAQGSLFLDIPNIHPASAALHKGELLWIHFPLDYSHAHVPDSPDLASLPFGHLLWSQNRWLKLGSPSAGIVVEKPRDPQHAQADSVSTFGQRRIPTEAVDAIWLLGSVGVICLAARLAKRRRKPSTVMNF